MCARTLHGPPGPNRARGPGVKGGSTALHSCRCTAKREQAWEGPLRYHCESGQSVNREGLTGLKPRSAERPMMCVCTRATRACTRAARMCMHARCACVYGCCCDARLQPKNRAKTSAMISPVIVCNMIKRSKRDNKNRRQKQYDSLNHHTSKTNKIHRASMTSRVDIEYESISSHR